MRRLKLCSGRDAVKILCNKFGFTVARQNGSHIVLNKYEAGRKITTVVPNHKEVKITTLKSVIKLAEVRESDFAKWQ